jgi:hypothetical protein
MEQQLQLPSPEMQQIYNMLAEITKANQKELKASQEASTAELKLA